MWGEAGGAAETRWGRITVAVLPNVREVDLIWRTVGRPGKPRRDGNGWALRSGFSVGGGTRSRRPGEAALMVRGLPTWVLFNR